MSPVQAEFQIAKLVAEVGSLPTVAAQVVGMTSDEDCELGQLTKVIMSDSVLTLRFLALANSAMYSGGKEIKDLRAAMVRLGIRRVRNVALCMGMHDLLPASGNSNGLDSQLLWRFSLGCASCARNLAMKRRQANPEDAYLTGLLHTIGIAALDQRAGSGFQQAITEARRSGCPLSTVDKNIFGFHHSELGAKILANWNIPALYTEVVLHTPLVTSVKDLEPEVADLVKILREASRIMRATRTGDNGDGDHCASLDELALRAGLTQQDMSDLAEQVDNEVADMAQTIGLNLPPENLFTMAVEKSQAQMARLGLEGLDNALARSELEKDLEAARSIQQRLLPNKMPELPYHEIAAVNIPSLQVSGDYFDFLRLTDDMTGLVIADISGKGMPAALLASNLQATLRALARTESNPGDLLAAVNAVLYESTDPDKFATLFLARLEDRELTYASAGHNPPLLLHADGTIDWLKPAGMPLGMVPDMQYPPISIQLAAGDVLVAYTDGVTEAVNSTGGEYAESGLQLAVVANAKLPAAEILTAIQHAVHRHITQDNDATDLSSLPPPVPDQPTFADDLTLIVLKVR